MDAVLLALLAGVLAGAIAVVARYSLQWHHDTIAGAFVMTLLGLPVVLIAVAATGSGLHGATLGDLWPFLAIGLFVPGLGQIFYLYSVRLAGPSRAGTVVGSFPIISGVLAVTALGEPLEAGLVAGTLLIVLGGVLLTLEPRRPAGFRPLGLLLAFAVAVALGARDNVVRWAAPASPASILVEVTLIIAAASAALLVYLVVDSRGLRRAGGRVASALIPFAPSGLLGIVVTVVIILALDRGRVTIVAPLTGTQALWAVGLAALAFGRREAIGRRLVLAAAVIVLGSVLVSLTR